DVFEPEVLFSLATIPGKKGQKPGTRDEIIFALQDKEIFEMRKAREEGTLKEGEGTYPDDPRFQKGGPYGDYKFSDEVKTRVRASYQKLGAKNTGHFASPHGRNKKGDPNEPGSEGSAGSNYHSLHEVALKAAYKAGKSDKKDISMGMA